jgi:hypothetical protein
MASARREDQERCVEWILTFVRMTDDAGAFGWA